MGTIAKNKTANTAKYSYKYVDIAQIHEYLESIGYKYYQFIDRLDSDDYIMTVKIDSQGVESKPIRGARIVDATLVGVKNPAQEQGSAITYARRYSLLMAFGLATVDDDAQCLSREPDKVSNEIISAVKANALIARCERDKVSPEKIAELYKVKNVFGLTEKMYSNINIHWDEVKERCAL